MATDEELKRALKAFKKRLKLTKLDEESGLSRGGGKKSGITGITPPSGHPPGIWEELVAKGNSNATWETPTRWSKALIPDSRFSSQRLQIFHQPAPFVVAQLPPNSWPALEFPTIGVPSGFLTLNRGKPGTSVE